jgi:hypothetical protein
VRLDVRTSRKAFGPYGAFVAQYLRTVKTSSGATAVQIVHSSRRGSRDIEHIGSAHDEEELATLKAAAQQRLVAGQGEFDLGLDPARSTAPWMPAVMS